MPAWLAAPAGGGAAVLVDAFTRQRGRVLAAAAAVRLAGAGLLLAASLILWRTYGAEGWQAQVPTLIAYGTLALVAFAGQGRSALLRLAWVQPLLDLGFAYAVLRTSILLGTASAEAIAGLSVAVFLLPVALSGLAFRTRALVLVTMLALLSEWSLMQQAGLGAWPTLTAAAVLLLAAAGSKLARETAEAEITRRLLVEARARYDQLSHLQKEKDSLLSIIVHDMRTPVSTAMLSLEYLEREMRRQAVMRQWSEAADEALASCSSLSEMIAQILDTTRLEAGRITLHLGTADAGELLDGAREHALTHARSKSVSIELDAAAHTHIVVDSRLLLRVLQSLLAVAIRQTPTGGRILLQAVQRAGEAELAVRRSGPRVPPEQHEAMFAKFDPADPAARRLAGWGLGLYFCRLAAEAQQARVTLESSPEWAASYVVRLPLATPAEVPAREPQGGGARGAEPPRRATLTWVPSPRSERVRAAFAEYARAIAPLERELKSER